MLSELYKALAKLHKRGKYLSNYLDNIVKLTPRQLLDAIKETEKSPNKATIDRLYYYDDDEHKFHDSVIHMLQYYVKTGHSKVKIGDIKYCLKIADFRFMLMCVKDDYDVNGKDFIDAILKLEPVKIHVRKLVVIYQIDDWCETIEKYIEFLIEQTAATNRPDKKQLKF